MIALILSFVLFEQLIQEENKTVLYVTFPVNNIPNSIYSFSLEEPLGKIKSHFYSEIYTTININNKNYPLFIRPSHGGSVELTSKNHKSEVKNIYDISSLYNNDISEYDELETHHFDNKTCKSASPYNSDYIKYCPHKENVNFEEVLDKNKTIINKTLDLNVIYEKEENLPGTLGIKFPSKDDDDKNGIMKYLKSNDLITQQLWYFFKINNEYKLIFGSFPHQIFTELYDENDLKSTQNYITRNIANGYKIKFDSIYVGNGKEEKEILFTESELMWDTKIITGPTQFENYLNDSFLMEEIKNGNCFKEEFSQKIHYITNYHSYYCKLSLKTKLISKLNEIKFINKELESIFVLDENDLYYQDNEYIFMNIYFFQSNMNITYW